MLKIDSVVLCLPVNVPEHLFTDSFRLKKMETVIIRGMKYFLSQPIIQVSLFINIPYIKIHS